MSVRRAHCNVVGVLKPMFAILRYDVDEVTVNRHGKAAMRSGVRAGWELSAEGATRRGALEARLHTSPRADGACLPGRRPSRKEVENACQRRGDRCCRPARRRTRARPSRGCPSATRRVGQRRHDARRPAGSACLHVGNLDPDRRPGYAASFVAKNLFVRFAMTYPVERVPGLNGIGWAPSSHHVDAASSTPERRASARARP